MLRFPIQPNHRRWRNLLQIAAISCASRTVLVPETLQSDHFDLAPAECLNLPLVLFRKALESGRRDVGDSVRLLSWAGINVQISVSNNHLSAE